MKVIRKVKNHALDTSGPTADGWAGKCRCGHRLTGTSKTALTAAWRTHWRETRTRLGGTMLLVNDNDEPVSLGQFLDAMEGALDTQEFNALNELGKGERYQGRGWWVVAVT